MRAIFLVILCLMVASCQASGTHEGANLFANILTLEF